jgi:DegV family protein with EDD domain
MAKVLVVTDTVACLPKALADEHGIRVVPASQMTYDGKTYVEGLNISARLAYDIIRKGPESFITAAVTPGILLGEFRAIAKEHNSILFITISSALGAVSQAATVVADTFRKELPNVEMQIVDSKTCAGAEGLIVLAAAKAAKKGLGLKMVADVAVHVRGKTGGFIYFDTLRYTHRTGLMSKQVARAASLLNIKQVSRMSDRGTMEPVEKVRTRADGINKIAELIKKEADTDTLHFMVSHADAPEAAQEMVDQLQKDFKCLSMIVSDYSPGLGCSSGPGAMFVGFHPELNW